LGFDVVISSNIGKSRSIEIRGFILTLKTWFRYVKMKKNTF